MHWKESPGKQTVHLNRIYEREKSSLIPARDGDPIRFVHLYEDPGDREIIGFFASQFAYGNIVAMMKFLQNLFHRLGKHPLTFIKNGDVSSLKGMYYRFHKEKEIISLFRIVKRMVDECGSIGDMVKHFYNGDIRKTIWSIRSYFLPGSNDLIFFFPKPSRTNPLKRWNLYLRWMVRNDGIDVGLWKFMDKRNLIVPLDTHIFKIGRCIGWTTCKTPSYRAALEITEGLKRYSPEDPLKYDFFLCHRVGIDGHCTGRRTSTCMRHCILVGNTISQ